MAVLHKDPNATKEKQNFYQTCLDATQLTAIKPNANSTTVFRPIPEVDSDGNILPMIKSMTAVGPDFANIVTEEVVINTGASTKFSGICRASDEDTTEAINMVFPSLYIKLKSHEKRGILPPELAEKIKGMLAETASPNNPKIKNRIIQRTQPMGFMQGVALTVNGKVLDRPAIKQALILPSSLCANLADLLQEQHKKGVDIFDPKTGFCLVVKGLPPDPKVGRQITIFTAELGKQVALSESRVKELWVPWEKALKRYTRDALIMHAIRCYGADVVGVIFPDDVARLSKASAPAVVTKPAAAAPPKSTSVVAPAGPEELSLDGAVAGAVDDGAGDEDASLASDPATDAAPPASAADLASQYKDMLKNI